MSHTSKESHSISIFEKNNAFISDTVLMKSTKDCSTSKANRVSDPYGYISSYTAQQQECASSIQPWLFVVSPGQQVNITMIDFGYSARRRNRKCEPLG